MGTGLVVCGLNGAGKSTLGKALADRLSFYFIDSENLYFSETDSDYIYDSPRTHEEAEKLLFYKTQTHKNFVFASVKGDYGEAANPYFQYVVLIDVPKNIRLQRVKNRSFQIFGNRILPNGDLYEREKKFLDFVKSRDNNTVEEWVRSLTCPVIRVDGTKPVNENVDIIIEKILSFTPFC